MKDPFRRSFACDDDSWGERASLLFPRSVKSISNLKVTLPSTPLLSSYRILHASGNINALGSRDTIVIDRKEVTEKLWNYKYYLRFAEPLVRFLTLSSLILIWISRRTTCSTRTLRSGASLLHSPSLRSLFMLTSSYPFGAVTNGNHLTCEDSFLVYLSLAHVLEYNRGFC